MSQLVFDGRTTAPRRRTTRKNPAPTSAPAHAVTAAETSLEVEVVRIPRALCDEAVTRCRVLAHELAEHAFGLERARHRDLKRATAARVERRLLELLGHHLAEPLEAHDLGLHVFRKSREDRVALLLVERPVRLFRRVDPVERRLCEVDVARLDELWQVPPEEREEKRRDVVAVRVGVHQQKDLPVAELAEVEVRADAAPERRDDVRELAVARDLRGIRLLGVQHLAAQREDRLRFSVAALLRRAARRVALDDEELGERGVGGRAVRELAGEVQPVRHRRLARDLPGRRTARFARARREDDAPDDLFGKRGVLVEPLFERRTDGSVHLRRYLRVVEAVLRLALELRLEDVRGQEDDEALADVLGRDGDALREQLVRLEIVAHGLRDARPQPVLVRAARRSRNAVHVRAHVLVGRLGPHERELEPGLALAREVERASRRAVAALLNDVREPVRKAPFVSELVAPRRLLGLVEENDAEAAMEVRLGLEKW